MDKAPDAFRTISEVADDLDIPQHVLRFWETRFTQIKPMKRSGGRRYYRPDDVDLLRGIRRLLYGEGYTIRGVQRILKEQASTRCRAGGCHRVAIFGGIDEAVDAACRTDEEEVATPELDRDDDDDEAADGSDFAARHRRGRDAVAGVRPDSQRRRPRPLDVARLETCWPT